MSLAPDFHHIQLEILALQRLPPPAQALLPQASRVSKPVNMLSEVDGSQWVGCAGELLDIYVEGKFVTVLDHLLTQRLLGISKKVSEYIFSSWDHVVTLANASMNKSFSESTATEDRHFLGICWLLIASSFLHLFKQMNWTGPIVDLSSIVSWMPSNEVIKLWNTDGLTNLYLDGQTAYKLTSSPLLLNLSELILTFLSDTQTDLLACHWMLFRLYCTKQQLFPHPSPTLWDRIKSIQNNYYEKILEFIGGYLELSCEFKIEFALCYLGYYDYQKCKSILETVEKELCIKLEVTGELGKRTKFQIDEKAQLVLMILKNKDLPQLFYHFPIGSYKEKIENIPLDDDTLLGYIQFSGDKLEQDHDLSPIQQALILARVHEMTRASPQNPQSKEEIMAYLQPLLSTPTLWSIQATVLYQRSILESNKTRTIERSMRQLEILNTLLCAKVDPTQLHYRVSLIYTLPFPPRWKVKARLAALLQSLGCTQSASDIYKELEMWEELVQCFKSQGKLGQAEELVRKQISQQETADLWCTLGDITKNITYYEKAWTLSSFKSFRAQKSLGLYYLNIKEYEKSVPYLETSLELNALQPSLCFSLGWSALKSKKPQLAIKAYQKAVILDPDNAHAWSNLATAFLQVNSHELAYKALQEAKSNTFDDWQVLDNFVLVASRIGHITEAIATYHRLLDVKPKHLNPDSLKLLVDSVVANDFDSAQCPCSKHRSKLVVLFGRVTSMVTNDADLWELYSQLLTSSDKDSDRHKGLLHMQKAHSIVKQDSNWNKQPEVLLKIVNVTCHFIRVTIDVVAKDLNGLINFQLVSSIKLTVGSILKVSKEMNEDLKQIGMPNNDFDSIVLNLEVLYEKFLKDCFTPIQSSSSKGKQQTSI
ncbi:Tetratricopeptide repeat protein 27 [Oopsacas minuta]|uniref:Tetratricopeptide repeat protein 27 n=1 Tax=Oopsacas minuta TaxID=111878 RepID=A0AAV7JWX2_9METZ|nr:Tetratricopeptide repeat protein 27 [Oopsacas minuta]